MRKVGDTIWSQVYTLKFLEYILRKNMTSSGQFDQYKEV